MAKAGKSGIETEIIKIDPKSIKLLEVNARYMPPERYSRLVENIKHDGCLTSVPLVYKLKEDGKLGKKGELVCCSGNHRTKAAIDAGLLTIDVQSITSEISVDDFVAKQLSHNSLVGLDNHQILKRLWDEMGSIEAKLYSGLDKEVIGVEMPVVPTLNISVDFEQVTIVFLPDEKEKVREALEEIKKRAILSDENWIEKIASYDEFKKAIVEISGKEGVHNYATVVSLMAEYALRYMRLEEKGI